MSSNRFSIFLDDFLDDLHIEYSQSQAMKEKKDTFKYFSDSLLEISYNGNNRNMYMFFIFVLFTWCNHSPDCIPHFFPAKGSRQKFSFTKQSTN